MAELSERRRLWDGCLNIRDLGGYPTAFGRPTRMGAVLRGDNLAQLSPEGRAALRAAGVRTIIDLRSDDELAVSPGPFANQAEGAGIDYHHLALFGSQGVIDAAWIDELRDSGELYEVALERFPERFALVLRTVASAADGAILFHCHAGKDRTGLVAMFLLAIAGVSESDIVRDYAESSTCLAPIYDPILARLEGDPQEHERVSGMLITRPSFMRATLALLGERYGGALGYLESIGLGAGEVGRIRDRMIGAEG